MRLSLRLLFIALIFAWFFLPIKDTDFGWHLRCGQEWLNSGRFCFQNRYSYFLPDYFWGYSTWLYDILIALLFKTFGMAGMALGLGLLMALLAGLFLSTFSAGRTALFSFLIFIAFGYSTIRIGFRPQVVSLVCFLGLLLIIRQLPLSGSKTLVLWQVLLNLTLILWLNLHPSFLIGVIIYTIFSFTMIISGHRTYWLWLLCIWLSTLISPLGTRVFYELANHYTVDLSKLVAEWTAPSSGLRLGIIISLLCAFWLLFKQGSVYKSRFWFYFLCLSLLAIMAYTAKRHLSLYGLFLAFFLEEWQLLSTLLTTLKIPTRTWVISTFLLIAGATALNLQTILKITDYSKYYCQDALVDLPCQLNANSKMVTGNIFTMYEWGGYFIWQLPEAKVFVDGRMPAWHTNSGKSPYTIYLEIIQAQPGWEKTLIKHRTDTLAIKPGTFLDLELQKRPRPSWRLVKRLPDLVIYRYQSP